MKHTIIIGPPRSGKTKLAIELAEKNGPKYWVGTVYDFVNTRPVELLLIMDECSSLIFEDADNVEHLRAMIRSKSWCVNLRNGRNNRRVKMLPLIVVGNTLKREDFEPSDMLEVIETKAN